LNNYINSLNLLNSHNPSQISTPNSGIPKHNIFLLIIVAKNNLHITKNNFILKEFEKEIMRLKEIISTFENEKKENENMNYDFVGNYFDEQDKKIIRLKKEIQLPKENMMSDDENLSHHNVRKNNTLLRNDNQLAPQFVTL
jgi:hypothetical protein